MSAMKRITGADWSAWFLHLWGASFRGLALGMKSGLAAGAGSVIDTGKWEPSTIDFNTLLYAAIAGFLFEFCSAVADKPVPTGDEIDESPTPAP